MRSNAKGDLLDDASQSAYDTANATMGRSPRVAAAFLRGVIYRGQTVGGVECDRRRIINARTAAARLRSGSDGFW